MYVRPVGKAYVKQHGNMRGWWVVLIWKGEDRRPRAYDVRTTHRDAIDTAIWYNETYYTPEQTGENT